MARRQGGEEGPQPAQVFGLMSGGDGDSEASGAAADGRITDGRDEEPGGAGGLRALESGGAVADVSGEDGTLRGAGEARPKGRLTGGGGGGGVDVLPEASPALCTFRGLKQLECGQGGGCLCGRGCGAEHEAAGSLDEPVDEVAGAGDEASGTAEGFAQSTHVDFDLVGEAGGGDEAFACGAEKAGGVGFVDHQPSAVTVFEFDQGTQGRLVAVHAEDGLGDDEDAAQARVGRGGGALAVGPLEEVLKVVQVVVAEDANGGAGEASSIDQAGVGQAIENHDVASFH